MLSPESLELFARQGYLGPFDLPEAVTAELTAPAQLARIERVSEWALRSATMNRWQRLVHGGLQPDAWRNQHLYSRSLVRLVTTETILDVVRSVLGKDVLLWVAHHLVRKPGSTGQRWHVDPVNAYVRGVHVSVAVTPMNRDNGCLALITGSHLYRASLCAHEDSAGLDRSDPGAVVAFADRVAPWRAPHRVEHMELRAGQFFLTWGGLWHAVVPNRSASSRIACVARYARPDFRCAAYGYRDDRIEPGPRLPCLLVSGVDRFGLNDLRPQPAGDMFARAPFGDGASLGQD